MVVEQKRNKIAWIFTKYFGASSFFAARKNYVLYMAVGCSVSTLQISMSMTVTSRLHVHHQVSH